MAFAYMEFDRVDNITWAFQKLRGLITNDNEIPQVIVIDRDIALMNTMQVFFQSSLNLLSFSYKQKCEC